MYFHGTWDKGIDMTTNPSGFDPFAQEVAAAQRLLASMQRPEALKLRNSLKNSLLAGNSHGDRCDQHCVARAGVLFEPRHSHLELPTGRSRNFRAQVQKFVRFYAIDPVTTETP